MTTAAPPAASPPPLLEIEHRVQERAKDLALDMGDTGGEQGLRSLIDDELARWTDEFKRGLRPYDLQNPEIVSERALRNLVHYGPLTPLLLDDDVWEIMINAPDRGMGVSGLSLSLGLGRINSWPTPPRTAGSHKTPPVTDSVSRDRKPTAGH